LIVTFYTIATTTTLFKMSTDDWSNKSTIDQDELEERDKLRPRYLSRDSYKKARKTTSNKDEDFKSYEVNQIDHNLLALRAKFDRKKLPKLWEIPLDHQTVSTADEATRKRFIQRVHPLEPNGGDDKNYDPDHVRDDDDVWEKFIHKNDPSYSGAGSNGGGDENDEDEIDFPADNSNINGVSTIQEHMNDDLFVDSLPPPTNDAPFMDVPGLEGITIPEDVNKIPIIQPWRELVTEEGRVIKIGKFDMALIRPDFTIVVYGKRRSGKTQFVTYFMRCFRCFFPEVYVFTMTKVDIEYNRFVPEQFIFSDYKDEVIRKIIDRQKKRQALMRKRGVNDENINVLLILDDCITSETIKYSPTAREIFFNGRHLYISIIINSQHHKAIGPALRTNTDMVAAFPVRSQLDKETVRENYADFVNNDKEFEAVAGVIRENPYTIMFIDQARPYMRPEDCVYAGITPQVKDIGAFFMGSRDFWRGSEAQAARYDPEHSWLALDDWGIVKETYKIKMDDLPDHLTMELPKLSNMSPEDRDIYLTSRKMEGLDLSKGGPDSDQSNSDSDSDSSSEEESSGDEHLDPRVPHQRGQDRNHNRARAGAKGNQKKPNTRKKASLHPTRQQTRTANSPVQRTMVTSTSSEQKKNKKKKKKMIQNTGTR